MSQEFIYSSALDLIAALKKPLPATPLDVANEHVRALEKLAEIFKETSQVSGEIIAPPRVEKLVIQEKNAPVPPPRVPCKPNSYNKEPKIAEHPIAKSCIPCLLPLPKLFATNVRVPTPWSQVVNHVTTVNNVNITWEETCKIERLHQDKFVPDIANYVLCEQTGKPLMYRRV